MIGFRYRVSGVPEVDQRRRWLEKFTHPRRVAGLVEKETSQILESGLRPALARLARNWLLLWYYSRWAARS